MMSLEVLQVVWYIIFTIVLCCYLVLDGFDLGVGILHPFAKGDKERRTFLNAIGPVWDGNEVWLVVVVGSLLAGFPHVYATLLSSFYIPVMVFIFGLITRAVSIEFRGKSESRAWRSFWDWVFALGSIVIAAGLGFILGNMVQGIPLNQEHDFAGTFSDFFSPYTILSAVLALSVFAMHGAIYLVMKTEGELHDKMRRWAKRTILFFVLMYLIFTTTTLIYEPYMAGRFREWPWLFTVPVLLILSIINIPRMMNKGKDGWAFISSSLSIIFLVALYALGTFPNLVIASNDPSLNLTIANSYASLKTLQVLLVIVAIGIPLALAYFVTVYYIFRGKVKIDKSSY